MADNIEFTTVSPEEWEEIPAPQPSKKKGQYEKLIEAVEQGSIVKLEVPEEKNLKGARITIARRARSLGFIAEFRNAGTTLYVKRSEKQLEEKQTKVTARKTAGEKIR